MDLCYTDLRGGNYCDQVRQTGHQITWDDPRSPFKGTLREYRPGSFAVQNNGPTTVYIDVYGRNASSTPFARSIRQYSFGSADGIHAPN